MKSLLRLLHAIFGLLACGEAHAQSLAMERHVVAGGGGASTGGAFALTGTVGQPDAGASLSGGAFSLSGGFWALPVAVQTPGGPRLSVTLTNGLVVVSWPRPATGFLLEQTSAVAAAPNLTIWTPVPPPYQTNATHVFIATPPGGAGYYRLHRP